MHLSFLGGGKLPQALLHSHSALRLDPGYEPTRRPGERVNDVERLKEEGSATLKADRFEALDVSMGYRIFDRLFDVCPLFRRWEKVEMRATLLSNRATTLLKARSKSYLRSSQSLDTFAPGHEDPLSDTEAP